MSGNAVDIHPAEDNPVDAEEIRVQIPAAEPLISGAVKSTTTSTTTPASPPKTTFGAGGMVARPGETGGGGSLRPIGARQRDANAGGDTISIPISGGNVPNTGNNPKSASLAPVNARRSGSQAELVKKADGTLKVERRTSGLDVMVAVQKRMSDGAMPTPFNLLPQAKTDKKEIILSAEHALEKTGGKGAGGSYTEHMFPLEEVAQKFQTHIDVDKPTSSKGLTSAKAAELLALYGPNALTPPPEMPHWLLFLLQFTNLLMILLQVTAIACFAIYGAQPANPQNLYIAVLLYLVVIATCTETYHQESKAGALLEKFRALVPEAAAVIRDGQLKPVPAAELVIGDIIKLKSGDKIPADCRIIYNSSMKSDQSMITGESEPIEVSVKALDPNALEARNIIFNGALCVDGEALCVVIRTGDATLIGNMVELTSDVGGSQSTLKADIQYFVYFLTTFALFQSATVFVIGCAVQKINPVTVFINGFIVIMIGNVPQGLPTTVTACLFIVADRMGKRNVFVKKLDIIETLGIQQLRHNNFLPFVTYYYPRVIIIHLLPPITLTNSNSCYYNYPPIISSYSNSCYYPPIASYHQVPAMSFALTRPAHLHRT